MKKLRDKIDTEKMKKPEFLMVMTGTGQYAYQREDGIYVVPVGTVERLARKNKQSRQGGIN